MTMDLSINLGIVDDDACHIKDLICTFENEETCTCTSSHDGDPFKTTKTLRLDGSTIDLHIGAPMSRLKKMMLDPVRYFPFRRVEGILIVFDVARALSFQHAEDMTKRVQMEEPIAAIRIVGITLQKDAKRKISYQQGKQLAESYGLKYMEVSKNDYKSVEKAFHAIIRDSLQLTLEVSREESTKPSSLLRRMINPILELSGISSVPEELQLNPYTLDLYQKAMEDGVEKDRSIRVNVVGNYNQGKTSLTKRLLGKKLQGIKSTNGIDIERYTCHRNSGGKFKYQRADNKKSDIVGRLASVTLNKEIEDKQSTDDQKELLVIPTPAFQNRSPSMVPKSKRHLNSSVTFADTNDNYKRTQKNDTSVKKPNTFGYVSKKRHFIEEENPKRVAVLSEKDIGSFTKALNRKTSLLQTKVVPTTFDIWDFGGQNVFYATHTIFHSRRAIYLLVFDLSLDLKTVVADDEFPNESNNGNMEYFLKFWMQSIHSLVGSADGLEPKVILVGTHKDKIKRSEEQKQKYIKQYFENVRQLFDGTKMLHHLYPEEFAIDNTDAKDTSVVSLRESIARLGNEAANVLEIPAKWIQLEKVLKERKHIKIIELDSILTIDKENEFPIDNLEQVKLFLRYHHGKGTFVYFDEEPLSEYVVLDPQYLIDAFKAIITSERFCTTDPEIRPVWKKLLTEAKLENSLIDRQWGQDKNQEKQFLQYKEILLAYLTKHHIISEATTFDETTQSSNGQGWYIVPSMLKVHSVEADKHEFLRGKKQTHIRLLISFETSQIVPTIYHRYIAALIAKWSVVNTGSKSLIFTDLCVVRLDANHAGIVDLKIKGIELTVVNLCPSLHVDEEKADTFRRYSEAVIMHEFGKLRDKREGIQPYTLMYRCNHESHGMDGSINISKVEDLNKKKLVPCPDFSAHDLYADKAKSEWFQDWRKPLSVPNTDLDDKLIGKISNCIGENWQLLGYELGLTQVQLERIVEDHPRSTLMQIFYMLKEWSLHMAHSAKLDVLVLAMQNCQSVSIEWDGLRNIVDGIV